MGERIFLSTPHMCGEEMKYIQKAFDTNWVAPLGENVNELERKISEYCGRKYAVATSSGTGAIHLALKYVGVKKDDVVFCSSYTFSGTCNPVEYCGAKLVFIDSEYDTYNMSPKALEKAYEKYPNPAAILIVNLYGNPAKFDEICKIANLHKTPIVEDSAESLGSIYKGKQTGTFGDISVFSFNGNKIITTSGGGILVCDEEKIAKKILFWATQSRESYPWYQHEEIGYNYRMSNICAGIGCGQMTCLNERIKKKTEIYDIYASQFSGNAFIKMLPVPEDTLPNHWLSVITLEKNCKTNFMDIINLLAEYNIESRPSWKPMHMQPVFKDCDFITQIKNGQPVCEDLFERSLCLPSDTHMTEDEIKFVAKLINDLIVKQN